MQHESKEMIMLTKASAIFVATMLMALPASAASVLNEPPAPPYKKVSTLVKLPDFVPGLGTLYVDPKTLPEGPFLAYDHERHLVSTIYMVPLKDMDAQKNFADLASPGGNVDHVSLNYNAGHPGVQEPHYHIILWHVPKSKEVAVAK
jgi:hypothetical protein